MNKLTRIVTLTALFALAGAVLHAQDASVSPTPSGPAAPAETDIVVPDLVLQVEELELQQVTAVLPEEGALALGQVSIPLPGSDDLFVDEAAFEIPLPGVVVARPDASVFSSGRLGAGSANHIVGEVSLFKLGSDPRFRLRFSHEGLDGYQFNPAGTGYFFTTNVIDGWFAGGDDQIRAEVEAAFSEEVHGLQDESDYFSTGLRRTTAVADVTFVPDPLVEISGDLDAAVTTRIQASSGTASPGSSAAREQEFAVTPRGEIVVTIAAVDLVLSSSYFGRLLPSGAIPVQQDVDALAGLDLDLATSFSASARAGVQWDPAQGLAYPWSLSMSALLGDAIETNLAGGFRVERLTLGDLWSEFPVAAVGAQDTGALLNDSQWYGTLSARWSGQSGLALSGEAEFAAHDAVVDIGDYDLVSDQFPFVQRSMMSLTTVTSASWRPDPQIQVQAGWTGVFIDSVTGTPVNSVNASLRVSDPDERLSAVAEARSEFFPEPTMPWLGLSGSFALSEEIEFTLEFADLLAPVLDPGRPVFGPTVGPAAPFIAPGFRASLFTRISL